MWANWRTWPHLNLGEDQGADDVCATFWLKSKKLSLTEWWDFAHGAWCDLRGVLSEVDLYQFWLLMMMAWNLAHGPHDDDHRFNQMRDLWKELKQSEIGHTLPAFLEAVPRMYDEHDNPPECTAENSAKVMFDTIDDEDSVHKKGYKINLNRFFSGTRHYRDELKRWSKEEFKIEYMAVEMDMVGGKKLGKLMMGEGAGQSADNVELGSTASNRTPLDRSLRASFVNTVALKVYMYSQRWHYHVCSIIAEGSLYVEEWVSHMIKTLKDVQSSKKWLLEQYKGKFMEHVFLTFAAPTSVPSLERIGFQLKQHSITWGAGAAPYAERHAQHQIDEDMADLFGRFALSLGTKRLVRCLWLLIGWPYAMTKILISREVALVIGARFWADYEAFSDLERQPNKTKAMLALHRRSIFHLTCVLQYVEAPNAPQLLTIWNTKAKRY
jgi:hypothetical protein